jgi:hypothetical protein
MINFIVLLVMAFVSLAAGWLYAYLIDEAVKQEAWDKQHQDDFFI